MLFEVFHHISISQFVSEFRVISADADAGDDGDFLRAEFFFGDLFRFFDEPLAHPAMRRMFRVPASKQGDGFAVGV